MASVTSDRIAGVTASLAIKTPVVAATTADITLSAAQTVDGVAVVADDRVLVKDQSDGTENGIYDVKSGAWVRSLDFDGSRDVVQGTIVKINGGSVNSGLFYEVSTSGDITIGTTSIAFASVTPPSSYSAYIDTLLDDTSAVEARATLAAAGTGVVNTFSATQSMSKGADVASASTLVLGTDGNYFDVTGTTGISAITVAAGTVFYLQFDGALVLTHHATNLDLPTEANITTVAGDALCGFATAANQVHVISYQRADGSSLTVAGGLPRSYLAGLGTAVGTDTAHDIDISAGECRDSTDAQDIALSAITKQIDAAWAVGSAAGGLDTGAVANSTWYHIWAIKRSDTGVTDALFSTSATAPTMPTNYDFKRRIGAVLTDGSANILAYHQIGDRFTWGTPIEDVDRAIVGTEASRTDTAISTPLGVVTVADVILHVETTGSASTAGGILTSLAGADVAVTAAASSIANVAGIYAFEGATTTVNSLRYLLETDTSSQIGVRGDESTVGDIHVITTGWIDTRGKDD